MAWDGDALAGQMEEIFERQQSIADARAIRGASTPNERARSAQFESMRISRSRIMTQLSGARSEEHTSELQSQSNLVCRLLLEKKITRAVTPRPHRPLRLPRPSWPV